MAWIVVKTRRLCEHLVKLNLEEQKYDVYLPLSVEPGAPEPKPFFPSYVFAETSPREGLWRPIKNTRGVVDVLMTGEKPSFVSPAAIDDLRDREEDGLIKLKLSLEASYAIEQERLARLTAAERAKAAMERLADAEEGERLRIEGGEFAGFDVEYSRVGSNHRIWVFLSGMGGKVPVQVPAVDIARAA